MKHRPAVIVYLRDTGGGVVEDVGDGDGIDKRWLSFNVAKRLSVRDAVYTSCIHLVKF